MSAKQVSDKYKSKRSGILYIVTGLVVAVFIIFALVIMLVVNSQHEQDDREQQGQDHRVGGGEHHLGHRLHHRPAHAGLQPEGPGD